MAAAGLPWLSVAQMREVDRMMIDELGVSLVRMSENAGRSVAVAARASLGGDARGRRVLVLAGPGGNGAGGLAAARHLLGAGALVGVRLATPPERLAPVTAEQLQILRRLGVDAAHAAGEPLPDADVVVDAVLGYSQRGAPHGVAAELIAAARSRRVVALDVPSGLELDTGVLHEPHVRAETTVTLAAPKRGLRGVDAVGELLLADIGVPPLVYERLGIAYRTPFGAAPVVAIRP